MITRNTSSNQSVIFACGLVFFILAGVLGWEKLHFGFSFVDEGYQMTESWRLAAGDNFLKDKLTGAYMLYPLINSLVFRAWPDITLLDFRRLQFFLTIFSLLAFSGALYRVDKQYWYLPFIFSLFAFTGLDPVGMMSNMTYHTYPHLFITLHVTCLLLALNQENRNLRRVTLVASGVFLWGISFSVLHLSLIVLSPIMLFLVCRKLGLNGFSFDFVDLCYVLAPFLFCWSVFIAVYNRPYIVSVLNSISFHLANRYYRAAVGSHINWEAIKHIGVTMLVLISCILGLKKLRFSVWTAFATVMSVLMFFIIDTSFFHFITPYWFDWFSRPMWFCSLLISFFLVVFFETVWKHYTNQGFNRGEEVAIILLVPCAILSLSSSLFSTNGVLTTLHSSIPAIAAISFLVLYDKKIRVRKYPVKFLILIILFLPFYYTTAWSDWKFTFFDVFPEKANVTIENGFGRGIKTNPIYKKLYGWIRMNTERFTKKDDFIISYAVSPMVHMISKRRPSLDDTFMSFTKSTDYYQKCIELMKKRKRFPKMAFVFETIPAFYPTSLKVSRYKWFPREFTFGPKDPISRYVLENMKLIGEFKIHEGNIVRCFLDNKVAKSEGLLTSEGIDESIAKVQQDLKKSPGDAALHYRLGRLFYKNGELDKAIEQYKKALSVRPDYARALRNLAVVYAIKGEYDQAISLFRKLIVLQPDNANAYYNMACLYAKEGQLRESIAWLKKAIAKGYNDWDLMKTDKDLANIRGSEYYKELIRGR